MDVVGRRVDHVGLGEGAHADTVDRVLAVHFQGRGEDGHALHAGCVHRRFAADRERARDIQPFLEQGRGEVAEGQHQDGNNRDGEHRLAEFAVFAP